MTMEVPMRGPPTTPSQSPVAGALPVPPRREEAQASTAAPATQSPALRDFFEDELRGFRLLKGAHLTSQEKQNILTQTNNSTNFLQVRRALRTLFAEEESLSSWNRRSKVWWAEETGPWCDDGNHWDASDPGQPSAWFAEDDSWDWSTSDWQSDWQADDGWCEGVFYGEEEEFQPNEGDDDPSEQQFAEAYALANEAQRTLAEAREAVRKTRAARGYYAPESSTGKGMSPQASRSPSWSPIGKEPWRKRQELWWMFHLWYARSYSPQLSR